MSGGEAGTGQGGQGGQGRVESINMRRWAVVVAEPGLRGTEEDQHLEMKTQGIQRSYSIEVGLLSSSPP